MQDKKNYLPKFILQYFPCKKFEQTLKLIDLLTAQNKNYLVAAVISWFFFSPS